MTAYQVVNATSEDMDFFYKDCSMTVEGLYIDEDNLNAYYEEILKHTQVNEDFKFYVIKGRQMNEKYFLTGLNRYPDDMDIVVCTLKSMRRPLALAIPMRSWGGRWYNDVVINNELRERRR